MTLEQVYNSRQQYRKMGRWHAYAAAAMQAVAVRLLRYLPICLPKK